MNLAGNSKWALFVALNTVLSYLLAYLLKGSSSSVSENSTELMLSTTDNRVQLGTARRRIAAEECIVRLSPDELLASASDRFMSADAATAGTCR